MSQMIGDRYEIKRKVGGGGMAVVYLAEDTYLGREVALKVLRDQYTEDPEFVRHFHKEARAVATLDHPNIVRIYDFDADSQPAYIVMEFVQGPTVKEMIQDQGRLPADQAAEIAIQIAYGLEEAHRNHIVHKDVKSHNIMLNQDGQVRITDFGISQMLSNTTITHNKAILGSAHYFSPEQARGEHVSFASDIYSLGVVMYEMVTGQVPFIGENPVTVALKHIQEAPADPGSIVPDLPDGLADIIMICLQKDPEDRFANMGALAHALTNFMQGETTPASTPQAAYVPLAEDSIALPKDQTRQAADPEKDTPDRRQRNRTPWRGIGIATLIILLVAFLTIFATQRLLDPAEILAPSVENMSYEEAAATLRRDNLNIAIDGEEASSDIAEGYVIRQNPPAGTTLRSGATVGVVISTGTEEVEVPDVRNLTAEEARNTLEARGLVIGEQTEAYDDQVAEGRVISQSLLAGEKVAKGETVDLVLSLGEEATPVSVPDLRGQTQASAREILANAKLNLGSVSEVFHETIGRGLVVSQSLEPGQSVSQNSSVNIVVSKGPAQEASTPTPTESNQSSRTVNLSFDVPQSGTISVVMETSQGRREVYSGPMDAGDHFSRDYDIQGSGRFLIYLNGSVIDEVAYGN